MKELIGMLRRILLDGIGDISGVVREHFLVFVTICFVIFFMHGFWPFLASEEAIIARIQSKSEYQTFAAVQEKLLTEPGQSRHQDFSVAVSNLIYGMLQIKASRSVTGVNYEYHELSLSMRWDSFILFIGGLSSVLALIFYVTTSEATGTRDGTNWSPALQGQMEELNRIDKPGTTEAVLGTEVDGAYRRASDLYTRSTLLLICGILMAFVGVGIFYVTLPQYQEGEPITSYLSKAVRPSGVLVSVEAIAWFLLRQYRALIEDYKWFHRVYLKRANYLAAYKLIEPEDVRPEALFLAANLLNENLSGRLSQYESTESLEAQKSADPNAIFEFLSKIIGQYRGGGST